jgi:hypothetical protein
VSSSLIKSCMASGAIGDPFTEIYHSDLPLVIISVSANLSSSEQLWQINCRLPESGGSVRSLHHLSAEPMALLVLFTSWHRFVPFVGALIMLTTCFCDSYEGAGCPGRPPFKLLRRHLKRLT